MSAADWPDFVPYGKTARLGSKVQITEKLDGTNAHILIVSAPAVPGAMPAAYPASRNRWLPEDEQDNYGFGAWVRANADDLATILGPGRHYGEWWGQGVARGYGVTGKRFSLFDTRRYGADWTGLDYELSGVILGVVPVVAAGPFTAELVEHAKLRLEHEGSLAAPGYMRPEGMVIRWADNGHVMKVVWDKGEGLNAGRHSTPKKAPTGPKWTAEQIEEAREAARLRKEGAAEIV